MTAAVQTQRVDVFANTHRKEGPPVIDPGTYTPRHTLTQKSSPSSSFGKASRFSSGLQFITSGHQTVRLCREGDGPKYNIKGHFGKRGSPKYSLGPAIPISKEEREREATLKQTGYKTDLGPNSYSPRHSLTKSRAATVAFGKSQRFGKTQPFISETFSLRSPSVHEYKPPPNQYNPNYEPVSPRAYAFKWGPGMTKKKEDYPNQPRTSFITHNIRGGKAVSATSECGISPGEYSPSSALSMPTSPRNGFSKGQRFKHPDPQFHGRKAVEKTMMGTNSPGPKYSSKVYETGYRKDKHGSNGVLHWRN